MPINMFHRLTLAGLLAVSVLGAACTQMPTEKQGVSDLRPQISFKVSEERLLAARVQVDGLEMGAVGDFIDGTNSLKLVSGTHVLRVSLQGNVLLEERFYSGDGVNRSFAIR